MNRSQFLKSCACALCSCAAAGSLAPVASAADGAIPREDWRLGFVKKRYAKMIELLSGKLDDGTLNEILRLLGYDCAANYSVLRKHKGDVDGFIREFKERAGEDITYDRKNGIVTVISPERTECTCPLIAKNLTSSKVCNCSLGWQQCAYETLLGKKVRVELTESVLRGGKRCCFKIQVLEENA